MQPVFQKWLAPLLFVLALLLALQKRDFRNLERIIWSDGEGYYLYLPTTFIYDGWQAFDGEDGAWMVSCCAVGQDKEIKTRYTYGVSAMQAPFFFMAHAYASVFQGPGTPQPPEVLPPNPVQSDRNLSDRRWTEKRGQATGFSSIYGFSILMAGCFYLALGLWFLQQILSKWFSGTIVTMTLLAIFLGTNTFYYSIMEVAMSHIYSFALFAGLLFFLDKWLHSSRWKHALALGLIAGLIFLIRPTNIVVLLFFFGWEVYSIKDLKTRFAVLLKRWPQLLSMAVLAFLVLVPQMLYWKHAFGSALAWSYGKEGFSNWNQPKMLQVLLSPQNGWLLYTPLMFLSLAGLVSALRQRVMSGPVLLLVMLLATYTFGSWWAWWFGGAFGHRCYVEFYPLLALPLALVLKTVVASPQKWLKMAGLALLLGFCYFNIKLTYMYSPPWDGPDWGWANYWGLMKNVAKFWWWPGF